MARILKYTAGVFLILFAALWAMAVFISTIEGIITMPANATPTQAAIIDALRWLADSSPINVYFIAVGLFALGFGVLFWHPEKGWAFYFEKPLSASKTSFSKPVNSTRRHDEPKEFVTKPLGELFSIFETHNNLQAEQLFSVYIGLWFSVEGKLSSIVERKSDFAFQLTTGVRRDSTDVFCLGIPKSERARLMRFEKDARIVVQGQIQECNSAWITLINCDIVTTNPPAAPPQVPAPQ
jgi:hypothetical protein